MRRTPAVKCGRISSDAVLMMSFCRVPAAPSSAWPAISACTLSDPWNGAVALCLSTAAVMLTPVSEDKTRSAPKKPMVPDASHGSDGSITTPASASNAGQRAFAKSTAMPTLVSYLPGRA